MPASTSEILDELDGLLEPGRFDDYCVNGLQVPGPLTVGTLATGVSAHAELFELAAAEGADMVLVHHGLLWGPGARTIDPLLKRRLQMLFDADMALAAYHLPLDAHPELGNNALLARALDARALEPFALHRGQPIAASWPPSPTTGWRPRCCSRGSARSSPASRSSSALGRRGCTAWRSSRAPVRTT
jgi:putative NIF3 family GTP cyclohydrolase 1 type 2